MSLSKIAFSLLNYPIIDSAPVPPPMMHIGECWQVENYRQIICLNIWLISEHFASSFFSPKEAQAQAWIWLSIFLVWLWIILRTRNIKHANKLKAWWLTEVSLRPNNISLMFSFSINQLNITKQYIPLFFFNNLIDYQYSEWKK